jgi:hypothetical protein
MNATVGSVLRSRFGGRTESWLVVSTEWSSEHVRNGARAQAEVQRGRTSPARA